MSNEEYKILNALLDALKAASDHLDYCGYGDSWERECAYESKLPQQIEEAIKNADQIKNLTVVN